MADLANDTIYEINRENLQEMDRFGTGGRQIGQFHWPHVVSVDSEGNVYTGEVDSAGRVQKFLRYGPAAAAAQGMNRSARIDRVRGLAGRGSWTARRVPPCAFSLTVTCQVWRRTLFADRFQIRRRDRRRARILCDVAGERDRPS